MKNQKLKKAIVNFIYDGDTLSIKADVPPYPPLTGGKLTEKGFKKIRLAFIDTQEFGQPFYLPAKKRLLELLPINSQIEYQDLGQDKYGRTLVEIYKNNQFINEVMVAEGLAVLYPFMHNPYYSTMIKLQLLAKQNKLGIWSQSNPVMPWDFRTMNQNGSG